LVSEFTATPGAGFTRERLVNGTTHWFRAQRKPSPHPGSQVDSTQSPSRQTPAAPHALSVSHSPRGCTQAAPRSTSASPTTRAAPNVRAALERTSPTINSGIVSPKPSASPGQPCAAERPPVLRGAVPPVHRSCHPRGPVPCWGRGPSVRHVQAVHGASWASSRRDGTRSRPRAVQRPRRTPSGPLPCCRSP
jgi:hypothetical protein